MVAAIFCTFTLTLASRAQVNSGSNGSDGAFNPTTNIVIDMHDHPDGIYQYTSVNISNGVTVTFIPNANNTPVVWLVQGNCVINGTVDVSGQGGGFNPATGGLGGPGGWRGGNGGPINNPGYGPGGGVGASYGGNASYGSSGGTNSNISPGSVYGNNFLIPLVGGSGGGGCTNYYSPPGGYPAGGGGGGAVLIAASGIITVNGSINASGGSGVYPMGGEGSGGAIRLVASTVSGFGGLGTDGGYNSFFGTHGGMGRVRIDAYEKNFSGGTSGVFSQGFQPIIIPTTGQGAQLTVTSVGGGAVSASPTGTIATPDAVLSAQQNNPIPIVVHCSNIPLNTLVTVSVKPANGSTVSATGYNATGTQASSTATISINIPRGGGIIYATAAN